jgi:2',3'-cyclic-nucleotide 2'-phosphodiesterase (5'-nucleotidase family)
MQYDASGISPDDFKFGLSFLTKAVSLSRFQWLSANIECVEKYGSFVNANSIFADNH